MLKIHETTTPSGELETVLLRVDRNVLTISTADGSFALPGGALEAVMRRFGLAFEPDEAVVAIATLDLGGGTALRRVRHLARYDVIARDYLVYEKTGLEPLCALATTVAGALAHLGLSAARAASRR
jgi:hypothetical protein